MDLHTEVRPCGYLLQDLVGEQRHVVEPEACCPNEADAIVEMAVSPSGDVPEVLGRFVSQVRGPGVPGELELCAVVEQADGDQEARRAFAGLIGGAAQIDLIATVGADQRN